MSQNKFRTQKLILETEYSKVEIEILDDGKIKVHSENSNIQILTILDQAFKQIQNANKYGIDNKNQ